MADTGITPEELGQLKKVLQNGNSKSSKPDGTGGSGANNLFGSIMLVVAVIAGVYAMIQPMGQRIDFLQTELATINTSINKDNDRERTDAAELSKIREMFTEVETRFEGLRREHELDINQIKEAKANQEEMINQLTTLGRCRAVDEHKAMMIENSLKMDKLEQRICVLEGLSFDKVKYPTK